MTGPNKHSRGAGEGDSEDSDDTEAVECRERARANRGLRRADLGTLVRVLLLIWEVIRTLIDEHIFPGAGPGRLP